MSHKERRRRDSWVMLIQTQHMVRSKRIALLMSVTRSNLKEKRTYHPDCMISGFEEELSFARCRLTCRTSSFASHAPRFSETLEVLISAVGCLSKATAISFSLALVRRRSLTFQARKWWGYSLALPRALLVRIAKTAELEGCWINSEGMVQKLTQHGTNSVSS